MAKRFNLSLVDLIQSQPNGTTDTYYFLGNYYSVQQADADANNAHASRAITEAPPPPPPATARSCPRR